ncbi:MAG TPA: hypothetical protein VLH85_05140, partial [Levilinea sp.]|nr:hypothetical protein [Levilinea sp.]
MTAVRIPLIWLWRVLASCILLGLSAGALSELVAQYADALALGQLQESFLAAAGLVAGSQGIVLLAIWLPRLFTPLLRVRASLGPLVWLAIIVIAAAPIYIFVYSKWSSVFSGIFLRSMVYIGTVAIMAWLAAGKSSHHLQWRSLLFIAILFGAVFILSDLLKFTVSHPFGFYWSEGNRMWDNSLMFARHLYDYPASQRIPVLSNWVRMSMWGLPHLLPNVSIAFVRMWDSLVFSIPYMIFGWALFWRKGEHFAVWLSLGLWTFLFINQGPIYSPLVLGAIIVALSRRTPTWLGFLLVGVAGYYVATGRYTWMFAPAMWAAVVALLEIHPYGVRTALDRWKRAILMGLGGLAGGYLLPEIIRHINAW